MVKNNAFFFLKLWLHWVFMTMSKYLSKSGNNWCVYAFVCQWACSKINSMWRLLFIHASVCLHCSPLLLPWKLPSGDKCILIRQMRSEGYALLCDKNRYNQERLSNSTNKSRITLFYKSSALLAVIFYYNVIWITCWSVRERRGVVSQLLPPAMSAVQPAAETHQGQPRGHAEPCDEGRLPHHAGDLLRYAEVAAFVNGRCFVCWESWKEKLKVVYKERKKKKTWPFKQCSLTFSYPEMWGGRWCRGE